MLLVRVFLHVYYAVIRANLTDTSADSIHPRVELISMLKIPSAQLPALPTMFSDYPLPPEVLVPETRLLRYFPTILYDLPAYQRTSSSHRFYMALRL